MAKNGYSKTILIIVAIVLVILVIGGIIAGISIYYLYRVGTTTVSPTPQAATSQSSLLGYSNARYSFSIKYPDTLSKQESQNGDGVTLTSNDPAITIRVYASMNALSQNLDEYLNWSRDNLFKEQGNGEEILAEDVNLGGLPAKERQWKYKNSVDDSQTVMDQVTTLKDDTFYTALMVVGYADYDEYSAHLFDQILGSFKFE